MTDRRPPVTDSDCRLIGAGDGSVMVYCTPCRACLCPRATTLNAALGFWEEHRDEEHQPCGLCGLVPREGEQHRAVFGGGPDGDDVEEVCVGEDRHQLDYAPAPQWTAPPGPDPWALPLSPPPGTVLAEVMTEVAIAELPAEEEPSAILEGLAERGWQVAPAPPF